MKTIKASLCINQKNHTEYDVGYNYFMDWCKEMTKKGFKQKKCKGCGLYVIWEKSNA